MIRLPLCLVAGLSLAAWGDAWLDEGAGPPVLYQHKGCGKIMKPVLVCSECGEAVTARDVIPMPGPGLLAAEG